MKWLVENWVLVIAALSVVIGIVATWRRFYGLPRQEQMEAIQEWLLYAVIEAERELGSGTGKLKLRQVYDMFAVRFPWAAQRVPFNLFSVWVDAALLKMQDLLKSNNALKQYVDGITWEER